MPQIGGVNPAIAGEYRAVGRESTMDLASRARQNSDERASVANSTMSSSSSTTANARRKKEEEGDPSQIPPQPPACYQPSEPSETERGNIALPDKRRPDKHSPAGGVFAASMGRPSEAGEHKQNLDATSVPRFAAERRHDDIGKNAGPVGIDGACMSGEPATSGDRTLVPAAAAGPGAALRQRAEGEKSRESNEDREPVPTHAAVPAAIDLQAAAAEKLVRSRNIPLLFAQAAGSAATPPVASQQAGLRYVFSSWGQSHSVDVMRSVDGHASMRMQPSDLLVETALARARPQPDWTVQSVGASGDREHSRGNSDRRSDGEDE